MKNQNYRNHSRYLVLWHFVTPLIMLAILIGSIINLTHANAENRYTALLLLGVSVVLFILWVYARNFALRAQDRAIRAEENFRHFMLTGKPHNPALRLGQIIALRFASDEEMPDLAVKAAEQKLSQKQIKQLIQSWRPDYYRA